VTRLSANRVVCLSLLLCASCFALARGANKDRTYVEDSFAAALHSNSVFLHGYIHGYAEGFHNADIDIQMAHGFRDVSTMSEYKKVADCPANAGEKSVFERGFRQGFRVGYVDGISGRSFRAVRSLRIAMAGLSTDEWNPRRQESFEMGIQEGYYAGQSEGLHDGRTAATFRQMEPGCSALDQNARAAKGADYCDGFRRAFSIGYSDGYTNQQDNPHVAAK
jgi:hypothetical protein